jgi:Flp pilus assembly protein TadB
VGEHHETAPLDARETQALRAIAQELTRTDPRLLAAPGPASPPGRWSRVRFGGAVLVGCVLVAVLALAVGPFVALVAGTVLAVVGTAVAAATRPHGTDAWG